MANTLLHIDGLPKVTDLNVLPGEFINMDFLLVCTCEENGENPELVMYKKR